ncbi:helix-turn-helix domain-containing protein [Streptomyces sp. NPDC093252]|uniref:helix-turn-helix domain-containing protein n=1 Tax=Streptomyces sp. NPDC093252 TaxID=3154980 RepID=UPI00343B1F88
MRPDLTVPHELWDRPAMRRALTERDIGTVFRLVRQYTGASQSRLGAATGLAQSDIGAIERGVRAVTSAGVLGRVTAGLGIRPASPPRPHPRLQPAQVEPHAPSPQVPRPPLGWARHPARRTRRTM